MKQKYFFICIILLIIVLGEAVVFSSILIEKKFATKNATLIINDTYIITENVKIRYHKGSLYADLPLTQVLIGLGMNVEWLKDNVAEITYKDSLYILNLTEVSLIEKNDETGFNLIIPAPDGHRVYSVLEKELVLDDGTIRSFMRLIHKDFNIDINEDKLLVTITSADFSF